MLQNGKPNRFAVFKFAVFFRMSYLSKRKVVPKLKQNPLGVPIHWGGLGKQQKHSHYIYAKIQSDDSNPNPSVAPLFTGKSHRRQQMPCHQDWRQPEQRMPIQSIHRITLKKAGNPPDRTAERTGQPQPFPHQAMNVQAPQYPGSRHRGSQTEQQSFGETHESNRFLESIRFYWKSS